MFVKYPTQIAKDILPPSVIDWISPIYGRIRTSYYRLAILLNRNEVTYRYKGSQYTVRYTPETVFQFKSLVECEKMSSERVPLKYLDSTGELDAFIDVGAHFGMYSVVGSQLNPEASVYSFEPDKYNRAILKSVLDENDIAANIRSEVVTDESGSATFYVDQAPGSQRHSTTTTEGFESVTKDCVALSDFLADRGVDQVFLKIDAEGGEGEILEDIFSASLSYLEGIVELHPDKLSIDVDNIITFLHDKSDTCIFITDSSPNHPNAESINFDMNRPIYYFQLEPSHP